MSLTHSFGLSRTVNQAVVTATLAVGIFGFAFLLYSAFQQFFVSPSISCVIYGASLLVCSACSCIYTMRTNIEGRRFWRHLDHAAIFILIAGTYTPFVSGITGPFGISLTTWAWGLAALGVTLRLLIRHGYARLFTLLYILIGWLFITALPQILDTVNSTSLILLAAGAASYTIGALLFAKDIGRWTDPVWHSFVLGGSALHFAAVLAILKN